LTHTARVSGALCCGLAGRAYALLAVDRVDPDRGWYDRALVMATRAADEMLNGAGPWPNSLYFGYPGLVCLTQDLLRSRRDRLGLPLLEG
jgi:hypothetical protein